jgi:glycosyltransferase involved in cell wall biosynthesis
MINKLNVIGPYNSLGYGYTVKNILLELSKVIPNLTYFPIGNPQIEHNYEDILLHKLTSRQSNFDFNAHSLQIWHQHDLLHHRGNGLKIGFPIFELDTFNEREEHILDYQDVIFVCSHWAKQVVLHYLPHKRVFVIPLGVDSNTFYPTNQTTEKCTFLNIGKAEYRKGHDVLVKIFNLAFSKDDNVELKVAFSNPFLKEPQIREWNSLYRNSDLGDKIQLVPRLNTHDDIAKLINESDCGIFPSRAEGWNLEALEMLACGKQLIITNYSGHTEYCNNNNSMLIDCPHREVAHDNMWFKGDGNWLHIGDYEIGQMVRYMRKVYLDWKDLVSLYNKPGVETAKEFSWANTANKIYQALESL